MVFFLAWDVFAASQTGRIAVAPAPPITACLSRVSRVSGGPPKPVYPRGPAIRVRRGLARAAAVAFAMSKGMLARSSPPAAHQRLSDPGHQTSKSTCNICPFPHGDALSRKARIYSVIEKAVLANAIDFKDPCYYTRELAHRRGEQRRSERFKLHISPRTGNRIVSRKSQIRPSHRDSRKRRRPDTSPNGFDFNGITQRCC